MQQKSTRMHVTQKQQTHQHLSPKRSQSHYNWLISNGYHINPFSKQGLGTVTLSPYYQETYFLFTAQVLLFHHLFVTNMKGGIRPCPHRIHPGRRC